MTVKAYKDLTGKTNRQLTEEFRSIQPEVDEPLVSRMVSGIVQPSTALTNHIEEMVEKLFANRSDAVFGDSWAVYRPDDLTPLESVIFDRLEQASRYAPVSRHQLCMLTGLSDRSVRSAIEAIRKKGGRVCTSSQHYGYWIAKNSGDYEMLRAEYISRRRSIDETIRAMDGVLAGQITWAEQLG